jgi:outer membrane protein assembly factor BamE
MIKRLIPVLLLTCIALPHVGCRSLFSTIRIIDVEQGNIIEQNKVKRLRKGMSKQQVRDLLGDPVKVTTFNRNRWEYVYTLDQPAKRTEMKKLVLYFDKNGQLTQIPEN